MRIEARTERTVNEALRRSVAAHPDKPFLVSASGARGVTDRTWDRERCS